MVTSENEEKVTRELIDECFEGDKELYEAALDDGILETLSWDEIEETANLFPEYDDKALLFIEKFLGFLPEPLIYLPHLPYIRAALAYNEKHQLSLDHLLQELDFHLKRMRGDFVKKGRWNYCKPYTQADYDAYENHLEHVKDAVRQRLCNFLNLDPPIEYTLDAELYLREFFATDEFHISMLVPQCFDFEAATLVHYRMVYLGDGSESADNLPVLGWEYESRKEKRTKT